MGFNIFEYFERDSIEIANIVELDTYIKNVVNTVGIISLRSLLWQPPTRGGFEAYLWMSPWRLHCFYFPES